MSKGGSDRAHADLNTALVGEVEGYLKARICHLQAREEAEALCSRLPWATTAQAEEITRHYIEQRLTRTRHTLAHHLDELRDQYENRYQNYDVTCSNAMSPVPVSSWPGAPASLPWSTP